MSKTPACELCKKNAASVHFTEIADSEVSKLFICRDCAESRGLLEEAPSLEELMSSISKPKRRAATRHVHPCPKCGLEFADFQSQGRLGCPDCYVAFATQLKPLLRQIHEDWQHTGKQPRGTTVAASAWARVEALQNELQAAIEAEHYERAAKLRDQIRKARRTLGDSGDDSQEAGEDSNAESPD
jgi:protein arginine kinase activator